MITDSERSTASLNREYDRLAAELREMEKRPEYPWIDKIPGYEYASDRLHEIEYILSDREMRF